MPINVKTEVFEGPLDLLLELIEKRKLLINSISLSTVTDEYIARVKAMSELPLGETAEFVALAATLLLIKSRSLLPNLTLSEDESRDIKELEYRLAVFQIIKEVSLGLRRNLALPFLFEGRSPEPPALFMPDSSLSTTSLREAAGFLIEGFPQMLLLPSVAVKKIISIEEMLQRLAERVSSALRLSFREFIETREKPEIIVSFLALLELVKQGILEASQEKSGDITLESKHVATPAYE